MKEEDVWRRGACGCAGQFDRRIEACRVKAFEGKGKKDWLFPFKVVPRSRAISRPCAVESGVDYGRKSAAGDLRLSGLVESESKG